MLSDVFSIVALFLLVPLTTFLFKIFISTKEYNYKWLLDIREPSTKLRRVVLFYGLLVLSNMITNSSGLGGILAYFNRVAYAALYFMPILVGYWNFKLGKSTFYFCLFAIVTETVLTILIGNRFSAFLNIVLLYTGYYFSQPVHRRRVLVAIALILAPVLFTVIGVMGVVRDKIGRGSITEMVNIERSSVYFDAFVGYFNEKDDNQELSQEIILSGKGRNVNFVNLSVVALSPDIAPYRYWDNLDAEIGSIFLIGALNSGFSGDDIQQAEEKVLDAELKGGMARRYGYNVRVGNGVEWSFIADAWSRGGFMIAALYTIILFLIGGFFEQVLKFFKKEDALIFYIVLINHIFIMANTIPLYETIRLLILKFLFVWVILQVIGFFVNTSIQRNRA